MGPGMFEGAMGILVELKDGADVDNGSDGLRVVLIGGNGPIGEEKVGSGMEVLVDNCEELSGRKESVELETVGTAEGTLSEEDGD